jgi:hypothetical protein
VLKKPHDPRGVPFYQLTSLLLTEARRGRIISPADVRAVLGPPDLFIMRESELYYLYFFTDSHPSEAYLDFVGGRLTAGGYNTAGVNDLSKWRPYEPNR